MRTLFVGDVHACAEELDLLLRRAAADRVILLGDLFTKGPDPRGVWDLVVDWRCESILGNHDVSVLGWSRARVEAAGLPESCVRWLRGLPLWLEGRSPDGRQWVAVHAGLHPKKGVAGTSRERALNMRRFPDDKDSRNPFWWADWKGPPLVIYGHDARRKLVDRRPHTLGLDSGCVYGGELTGYLLEVDRLLSVPARAVWRPLSAC